MCGRFMLDSDVEEILKYYRIINREVDDYHKGDKFPSQEALIVAEDGGLSLKSAKWGFPLAPKGKLVINARSESIKERPMFKDAFHTSRCIIPASLFYEWKDEGANNKVKYNIYSPDKKITSLGGLYKFTLNDKGKKELSFVIMTTEANSYMNQVHSRMPLIIEDDAVDYWLDKGSSSSILDEIVLSNKRQILKIDRNYEERPIEQMKLF